MGFFSSYIKMILSVGICAFISSTVCENCKNSKTLSKAMATTVSICMFITVLLPLCSVIKKSGAAMDSLDKISVDVSTAFTENIEEATGLKITEAIKENLGTTPQSTYVSISSNNNEYAIEEIHIQLLNKDIDKKKQIEDLIRSISDENTNIKITEISK